MPSDIFRRQISRFPAEFAVSDKHIGPVLIKLVIFRNEVLRAPYKLVYDFRIGPPDYHVQYSHKVFRLICRPFKLGHKPFVMREKHFVVRKDKLLHLAKKYFYFFVL